MPKTYADLLREARASIREVTPQDVGALPPGGAKALVAKACGVGCHSIEVVTSQRMSEKDWDAIVRAMVARGAQASEAEVRDAIGPRKRTHDGRPRAPLHVSPAGLAGSQL